MRRYRYKYRSGNRSKPKTDTFTEQSTSIKRSIELLVELENIANANDRRFRTLKALTWNSPDQVCRSYRWMLNMRLHWMGVRTLFIELSMFMSTCDREFSSALNHTSVNQHLCNSNASSGDPDHVNAKEIAFSYPTQKEFALIQSLHKRWTELAENLDRQWHCTKDEMSLPGYMEIKKHLCYGWQYAHSILLACETGKLDKNKEHSHEMFGWTASDDRAQNVLRWAIKGLHPRMRVDKQHRASMTKGYELLGKTPDVPVSPLTTLPTDTARARWVKLCARNSHVRDPKTALQVMHDMSITRGPPNGGGPAFAEYVRSELLRDGGKGLRIRKKILLKVMQIATVAAGNNVVFTVPLDMPTHLGGDDYAVPCMWSDTSNTQDTWSRRSTNNTAIRVSLGWVYFRRGWPDMIHGTATKVSGSFDDRLFDVLENMLSPEQVRIKLDNASNSFFENKRDPSLSGLTGNQRKARILKKLRIIPALSRQDSFDVSNCVPGTEQFIKDIERVGRCTLGDGKTVSGREIAVFWKKAGYIQEDRFGNVVTRLHKMVIAEDLRRAEMDLRLDARIMDAMESDGCVSHAEQQVNTPRIRLPQRVESEEQILDDGSYVPVPVQE